VLSVIGVLITTENMQTPFEPHLAPTPVHRLSREQMRELVARINSRLYHDICAAAAATRQADAQPASAPNAPKPTAPKKDVQQASETSTPPSSTDASKTDPAAEGP
jgi:hypothetical protein